MRRRRWGLGAAIVVALGATVAACGSQPAGIHTIKHVVVIFQENRSFDSYFGTFPGADGIPMKDGVPTVCVPVPVTHTCLRPYHDTRDANMGGPHGTTDATRDVDGGRMDGFIGELPTKETCRTASRFDPYCAATTQPGDVMGYHDWHEIPNYWTYARDYVLQDRMFESTDSWSLPSHLYLVSAWSAVCAHNDDPMSCRGSSDIAAPGLMPGTTGLRPHLAWTDITFLLHQAGVSWAYYVAPGTEPDCRDPGAIYCTEPSQAPGSPTYWNPLPLFDTVRTDGELHNIQSVSGFYAAARGGTLPAVSWVVPNGDNSEHPPATVSAGMSYVTGLVNAVMKGPAWDSTAIFVTWDDWGGFYDHVVPPQVDSMGYGIRVPGLLISAYARHGYIDHQTLSFDAYLRFIEDDFLDGARLDPQTDGRPDLRPDVRETQPILGDLTREFDFSQPPRPPTLLPGSVVEATPDVPR